MRALFAANWMPNPPALQRAVDAGEVGVTETPQGQIYVVSKRCADRADVLRAIALREKWVLVWAALLGGGIAAVALFALRWLAHWSNQI